MPVQINALVTLVLLFKVGRMRRIMKRAPSSKLKRLNTLRSRVRKLNLPGLEPSPIWASVVCMQASFAAEILAQSCLHM